VISAEDYLVYVDEALDAMVEVLLGLGDDLANRRPDLPGANSAYALVTHCLGVMEFWGGHVVAGRTVERDRDAEFVATGSVDDLVARVRQARAQLEADLAELDAFAPVRGQLPPEDLAHPAGRTQGGALIHVYEELAQHRGHLELTRDVVVAAR
jgi:Protein of unknown function (DUF664)